ncbi:mitochondrial PPR repeat protein Ppr7 [Schizosaccharomyces osmophilus]|uniref:Mitochondrial PPR repeat protein Ppr7 n=1 Tax=Schizosaccharomyces osmophilus TaxID=2545709 RepID=A0AAF0AWH1_9SCHI|nr:mitochondrial PPR repeat protein Ppr7 [Schizosaccharomyces osmophilus]WBW73652.1 mitochondrial PPR repeat protein Ppr7 [Schizosaccharomyces osmophilus]
MQRYQTSVLSAWFRHVRSQQAVSVSWRYHLNSKYWHSTPFPFSSNDMHPNLLLTKTPKPLADGQSTNIRSSAHFEPSGLAHFLSKYPFFQKTNHEDVPELVQKMEILSYYVLHAPSLRQFSKNEKKEFQQWVYKYMTDLITESSTLSFRVYQNLSPLALTYVTGLWTKIAREKNLHEFLNMILHRFLENFTASDPPHTACMYSIMKSSCWCHSSLSNSLKLLYFKSLMLYHLQHPNLPIPQETLYTLKKAIFPKKLDSTHMVPISFPYDLQLKHVFDFLSQMAASSNETFWANQLSRLWIDAGVGPLPKHSFVSIIQLYSKHGLIKKMQNLLNARDHTQYLYDHRVLSAFNNCFARTVDPLSIHLTIKYWTSNFAKHYEMYLPYIYKFCMHSFLKEKEFQKAIFFFTKIPQKYLMEVIVAQLLKALTGARQFHEVLSIFHTYYSGDTLLLLKNQKILKMARKPSRYVLDIRPKSLDASPTASTALAVAICYMLNNATEVYKILAAALSYSEKRVPFHCKSYHVLFNGVLKLPYTSHELVIQSFCLLKLRRKIYLEQRTEFYSVLLSYFVSIGDFPHALQVIHILSRKRNGFTIHTWNWWLLSLLQLKLYDRVVRAYCEFQRSKIHPNERTIEIMSMLPGAYQYKLKELKLKG